MRRKNTMLSTLTPALPCTSRPTTSRPVSSHIDYETLSDVDLLALTRADDECAYGELWSRHVRVGLAVARRVTHHFDASDLVSEAFARILRAIRNGSGPREEFRGYLTTTIRAIAASWAKGIRTTVDLDSVPEQAMDDERLNAVEDLDSRHRVAVAFRALPERWKAALWYSTVEGRSNTEIGKILDLKPTAVAMLTLRARAGLRKEWDALSSEATPV
ncbi:RNA polymerase sigma factor [Leifsonia naganoensis]|uniref:RNA polymerase sigma factor (Sigma-70 family) n=1 Tax=Leifsonia naganoensis TaxID=150025 RepID=A0A853DUN1_9MICO|nr:sigma-70 family RNA polymerase sigma factor [Leifsonia naganoensis]NYK09475.1 RNA polymerase sigma factor (sigma-70 family) [Leifsonia naganoensis]